MQRGQSVRGFCLHTIELGDQVCQVQGLDQGKVAGVRGEEILLLVDG